MHDRLNEQMVKALLGSEVKEHVYHHVGALLGKYSNRPLGSKE